MLTQELESAFGLAVDTVCDEVSRRREVTVSADVRALFLAVLRESAKYRSQEWERQPIPLSQPWAATEIPILVGPLLDGAADTAHVAEDGTRHLLLVDVLGQICESWCRIFPICR